MTDEPTDSPKVMKLTTHKLKQPHELSVVAELRANQKELKENTSRELFLLQQQLEDLERRRKTLVAHHNKKWREMVLNLCKPLVEPYVKPGTDIEKALSTGEVYLELTFFDDHNDVFVCQFVDDQQVNGISLEEFINNGPTPGARLN